MPKINLNKKNDGFKENNEQIEKKEKQEAQKSTSKEVLQNVPPEQLQEDPKGPKLDPNSPLVKYFFAQKLLTLGLTLKNKLDKFMQFVNNNLSVKIIKEEPTKKEDIFEVCQRNVPCNLECLYGHKLDEEEEIPEPDTVKGLVYTKGGAVYETIAYRLPDDFGWEVQPGKEPKKETPYFENKKKKKKKPEIMEFTGPVKVIVVDKEGFACGYQAKRIHAAFIQLGYILIGCTIMCIYFYALKFNYHYSTNVHIISCLVAFQYCLPAALLLRDKTSIAGYVLSTRHQYRDSLIMKTLAMILIFGGVGLLHSWRYFVRRSIFTEHALPGYAACVLAVAEFISSCVFSLLLGHDKGHIVDCYHNILTISAMYLSLKSFYLAFILNQKLMAFIKYKHWYYWSFAFVVIFALTAVFRPLMDFFYHLWCYICKIAIYLYKLYRPHDPCTPRADIAELHRAQMAKQYGA